MTSPRKVVTGIFLIIALRVCAVKCGTFYVKTELSYKCTYNGYKPGGDEPNIQHIKSKSAKLLETSLQNVMGHFNNGAGLTAATLGVMNSAGKLLGSSPHIAATLGAISVAMGLSISTPGPQDILDKANEAVATLAADVNDRLDKMKDYVDFRVIELEKNLMSGEYKTLFYKWIHCAEERTNENTLACEQNVERALKGDRYKFEVLHEKQNQFNPNGQYRYLYVWQFLEKHADKYKSPSHYEVKRLEAALIPLRNFASLHLMVLQTLASNYKDFKDDTECKEYKHYLEDIVDRAAEYVSYVEWAIEWIYIRNYEENIWSGIPKRSDKGAPYFLQEGGFIPSLSCKRLSGSKSAGQITTECTVECIQMNADNTCTFTDTIYTTRKALSITRNYPKTDNVAVANVWNYWEHRNEICVGYLTSLKADLNRYWKTEVLDLAKEWEKYGENAKAALAQITDC